MHLNNSTVNTLQASLPAMAPALARLSRILFDERCAALAEQQAWYLTRVPPGASKFIRPARLHLHCASGKIAMIVDLQAHPALESAALANDGELRAALANVLLKQTLQKIANAGLTLPRVFLLELLDLDGAGEGDADAGLAIRFEDRDGAETLLVTAIDEAVLEALEQRVRSAAVQAPVALPYFLAALRLPGRVRIASRWCTPALLRSLRPGDVLLNWGEHSSSRTLVSLDGVKLYWGAPRGQHYFVRARIDHNIITIETTSAMNIDAENLTHHVHTDANLAEVHIAELELPVSLEIVTMLLPVEQIGALQPGHVLEMPVAVKDMQIRLMSYGQTLGFGQLVMVGEHLGLQISRMAKKNESDA